MVLRKPVGKSTRINSGREKIGERDSTNWSTLIWVADVGKAQKNNPLWGGETLDNETTVVKP